MCRNWIRNRSTGPRENLADACAKAGLVGEMLRHVPGRGGQRDSTWAHPQGLATELPTLSSVPVCSLAPLLPPLPACPRPDPQTH